MEEEDKPKKEIKELREEQKKHEKSKKKGKAKRQQEKLSLVDKLIKKVQFQVLYCRWNLFSSLSLSTVPICIYITVRLPTCTYI